MLSEVTIFQSSAWLKLQNSLPGRKAGLIKGLYWSILPTAFGQRYLYLNRPQEFTEIQALLPELIALARAEKCIYIKLEPNWPKETTEPLFQLGFTLSPCHIQPDCTLYLDLTMTEGDLLKQMKPKGRYNIKVAAKHKITYQHFDQKNPDLEIALRNFYQMLQTTSQRDHFGIHSFNYYQTFLEALFPYSKLYLAYYQDQPIAGLIAVFYHDQAIYYYGASDSKSRHTMATYGLQWQTITDAKQAGHKTYDFFGIAPVDAPINHAWHGVTDFKQKFGGIRYNYPGTFHYILAPIRYFFIHTLKKVRNELKKSR